ncbi:MAG: hypothetical protein V1663_02750 [archaeon]
MVTKVETIGRLKKEREYEEKLVLHLKEQFLNSIDSVKNMSEYERKRLSEVINLIIRDCLKNSDTLNILIQDLGENGEDNY